MPYFCHKLLGKKFLGRTPEGSSEYYLHVGSGACCLSVPLETLSSKADWEGPVNSSDLLRRERTNTPRVDEAEATSAWPLGEAVRGTFTSNLSSLTVFDAHYPESIMDSQKGT